MVHSYLKLLLASFIAALPVSNALSQDTINDRVLDPVVIEKKRFKIKTLGLYDNEPEEQENVRGFTQLVLFEDGQLIDHWSTENKACIQAKTAEDDKDAFMRLEWNKDQDGCDWVGMGIGWDGWKGKDLGYVFDTLALELVVRSEGDPFTNIPWAFCFEDYSGGQAWMGYNTKFLKSKAIDNEWRTVALPLIMFPFEENDVDLGNIKQMMIQVFAAGVIQIKSIKLIPFSAKLKSELIANRVQKGAMSINGELDEWGDDEFDEFSGHEVAAKYNEENLYLAYKIQDDTPLQNGKQKDALWNGDAVEIAFSTNPEANEKRQFFMMSDRHLGINVGDQSYVWDWPNAKIQDKVQYGMSKYDGGYYLEVMIPFKELYGLAMKSGLKLAFETAVDMGTTSARMNQDRWNSGLADGFHQSPKLWGRLILR